MSRLLSVNLAVPHGRSGINKQPVDHPVAVRAPVGQGSGLTGDRIGNTKVHGGEFQAVYAYAREDLDWWQENLSRPLPDGSFGENLTTVDVDVNGAVIGERWLVGAEVVLETTFGREPCATFQTRMGEPHWVKRFAAENRTGAYLRVITPGEVRAGDPIVVLDRPSHGVTIADGFRAGYGDRALARTLLGRPGLPERLRLKLQRHAAG